jgi:hypothetical protein
MRSLTLILAITLAGCSSSVALNQPGGVGALDTIANQDTDSHAGADAATETSAGVDSAASNGGTDAASDTAIDVATSDEFDSGLDPEDTGADTVDAKADVPVSPQGLGTLYAHTSGTLYRLDPAGFAKVAEFQYDKNDGEMTDIALDQMGVLYGVTFGDLFQCDKSTAKCKWLAGLPGQFNGLTFVPKGTVKPNEEALIGIGNDGSWNLVDVAGGKATIKQLGQYGGGLTSSGDAFSVEGIGTYATVKSGFFGNDSLASIDPLNGSATVLGDLGVSDLWGIAWYQGTFYGFASGGGVYAIDLATSKAKPAKFPVPSGLSWWGAGVSTRANGIP